MCVIIPEEGRMVTASAGTEALCITAKLALSKYIVCKHTHTHTHTHTPMSQSRHGRKKYSIVSIPMAYESVATAHAHK